MSCSKSVIKEEMLIDLHLEGTFNGHYFEIKGKGKGQPNEGTNTVTLEVTKGGPLPFGWHILCPQFQYGNKAFVHHPDNIHDYLKLSFPEGYTWERSMHFEDGGLCCITNDISLTGNCFYYDIKFTGLNFPPNGPVVQKKTTGWEPSTERLYPRDGVLIGDIHHALTVEGGGHYACDIKTVYRAKKAALKMPGYHYVDTKLVIWNNDKEFMKVEEHEIAVARHHPFYEPKKDK
uniref:GFP-like fluorescent chromoprotein dsFP483 n=2 Tax=Discosoma striata TaxID=105400 RepID=GFPL_DISST|nr:RecName: Full=GFP-like fluorescent chromoprotein dsFP483 [Discosoma striata]AAF03370.1 fluorescent protein FP483 [Discosoma striata]